MTRDQVRMMTALRHPNVVLFMAACTKPPKMCIVMEHMSLGSLYEVQYIIIIIPQFTTSISRVDPYDHAVATTSS
jgi:serine/threonine protein kinase